MKEEVLPLNIVVSCFYLIVIGFVIYVFKKANRPLKNSNYTVKKIQTKQEAERLDYNKLIAKSWLKKYTFIGSLINEDKKYLLKQFLYMSAYTLTCLKINKIIIWPLGFTLFITPLLYVYYEFFLKKIHRQKNEQLDREQTNRNAIKNNIQSELEIQQNVLPQIINRSSKSGKGFKSLLHRINQKGFVERLSMGLIAFSSVIMLMQTVYTLTNSVSNSGELNIASFLIIFAIQQFAIRPSMGLALFTAYKLYSHFRESEQLPDQNSWINQLCQQQIALVIIELEKQRQQNQRQRLNKLLVMNSPINKQKVIKQKFTHEKSTLMNLIMEVNKPQPQQIVEQLFFTQNQKQLFENGNQDQNQHEQEKVKTIETKRISKDKQLIICKTAFLQKQPQSEENDIDEIQIVSNQILQEHNNNVISSFKGDEQKNSPVCQTKRRHLAHRKNKRVLNLTGNSPYLQYLPDMLKKVDTYKQIHTTKQITLGIARKVL